MSTIPEEILKTLICAQCKKYLSVESIKVYPNKDVKCGRCVTEGDAGVISKHFLSLAKQFKFPCINRYEGCKVLLPYSEMGSHESICNSEDFDCPICSFKGCSFVMLQHFKDNHKESIYSNHGQITFSIKGSFLSRYALVQQDDRLSVVNYSFDKDLNRFIFEAKFIPSRIFKTLITQKIVLCSIDNKIHQESQTITCKPYNSTESAPLHCTIDPQNYANDVAVCKLFINKEVFIHLDFQPAIVGAKLPLLMADRSTKNAETDYEFVCTFPNISKLQSVEKMYSAAHETGGRNWLIIITLTKTDSQLSFLGVGLCLQGNSNNMSPCKVKATISLVTPTFLKLCRLSEIFSEVKFDTGEEKIVNYPYFASWATVERFGVFADSINIKVQLKIKNLNVDVSHWNWDVMDN